VLRILFLYFSSLFWVLADNRPLPLLSLQAFPSDRTAQADMQLDRDGVDQEDVLLFVGTSSNGDFFFSDYSFSAALPIS